MLKQLGVHGAERDFAKLVEDVQGHALSLNLLGSYLKDAHGGDLRKRDLINFAEANAEEGNGHAFHIMDAYLAWLEQGSAGVPPATNPNQPLAERSPSQQSQNQQLAPALLKLIGLFDRPATADCLAALWQAPAIEGLTEAIVASNPAQRNIALSRLETAKLLTVTRDASGALLALDSHPLIREYFSKYLKERQPQAFQAAHQRLYQHLCESTPHQPDSLEDLQPLYQAVANGCLAGLQQEAREQVYRDRILRGANKEGYYSTIKLGAFGADLGAIAYFFESPWQQVSPVFRADYQALLLSQAALYLRALGRLTEALEPMRAGLNMSVEQENWIQAAISAGNLSELELTLGDIALAVADAEQSVRHADASGDAFQRMGKRTTYADALDQAGRRAEAAAAFREAEALQTEDQPEFPVLYSLQGFRYCDLLLSDLGLLPLLAGQNSNVEDPATVLAEVMARATKMFEWRVPSDSILTIALDHLTLGRAHLYRFIIAYPAIAAADDNDAVPPALSTEQAQELNTAASELAAAVGGLRRSGSQPHLPRGLLTRAWLRRLTSQLGYADECVDIVVGWADKGSSSTTQAAANDGLPSVSPSYSIAQPCFAQADLDEAYDIAERGPMPLFLADIHLYRAGLFHNANPYPWESPTHDLAEARRLIEKHGYWRRKEELEALERVLL